MNHPNLFIKVTEKDDKVTYGRAFLYEEINWDAALPEGHYYLPVQQIGVGIVNRLSRPATKSGLLLVDPNRLEVLVEGKVVLTTPKEFKAMKLFIENQGKLLTRNQIIDHCWGSNVHVYIRNVDTLVSKLRKKFKHVCEFESRHATGYIFNVF